MSFDTRGGGGSDGGGGGGGYGQQARGYQVRDGDDAYLNCSQKITSNIYTINQNVNQIQKFTKDIGTIRDTRAMRNKMHNYQDSTRRIIGDTVKALKQLGQFSGGSERERSQHRMEQEKLTNDFKQVLSKFQTISQVAMKHERDTVARDRASSQSGGGGGGYGDDQYDEKAALIHEEQREKMQRQGDLIDGNHDQIVEREEAIKEIESTMLEVNEIYRDLNTLVIEQGNALDNIESNMSQTENNVDSGVEQLRKASRYQKKGRNKMCCMLGILVIVLAVIVLVILSSKK